MTHTQLIVNGITEAGELIWETVRMERWQEIQLYFKPYTGGFMAHWMEISSLEKGYTQGGFGEESENSLIY